VPEDLAFECAGFYLDALLLEFGFYTLLLILSEFSCCRCCSTCSEPKLLKQVADNEISETKDESVRREETICDLLQRQENQPEILASHLKKLYEVADKKIVTAVDDVTFFVKKGECFALLGTSGAGKTTTFKMITNDIIPTEGYVNVQGLELFSNFSYLRKQLGYAPQYESAYMSMTVRENLEFYGKIKGIPSNIRSQLISKMIKDLRITEYENVEAGNLSGGNKRKLTVAIALLGNPAIVLLDEPSTGVDPQAKRFMWQIIQQLSVKSKNTAVLLTTHSMEEAEHLCTKMAMMVSGNFCCIDTPQELKQTYGKGFEIQINIPIPTDQDEIDFLNQNFIPLDSKLSLDDIKKLFTLVKRSDLIQHLSKTGSAAHIFSEIDLGRQINPRIVANFILVEQQARNFAVELANEFDNIRIMEHLGNYFKFRVTKMKSFQTIGYLFGFMQDLVTKYKIVQYSTTQTSLTQIFHSFAKKDDVFFRIYSVILLNSME